MHRVDRGRLRRRKHDPDVHVHDQVHRIPVHRDPLRADYAHGAAAERSDARAEGVRRRIVSGSPLNPGAWRRNRTGRGRTVVSCPGKKALREGLTAMVVSPSYVKGRRIEFRAGSYVYRDSDAASKALHITGAPPGQACRARLLVRLLRAGGYETGSATVRRSSPQGIGQEAQFVEITVPVSFRGRRFKSILDQTAAREGRLIEGFVTLAGASTARYNQEFAAVFADIARAAQ
jgi:hypothetical protein